MFSAKLVSGLRVVLIEEFPGKEPSFNPPFIAIDDERGVARRCQHDIRCGANLVRMAKLVDLREKEARVRPKGRGNLGKQLVARCLPDDRGEGLGERQHVGPSQGGGAECRGRIALVEQTFGPELMVVLVEITAEISPDL